MHAEHDLLQPVETERLRLRCVRLADAANISILMTPAVSRWLISWPAPFSTQDATNRIRDARVAAVERRMLPFVIEQRSNQELLGWLSVTRNSIADRHGLLSYWMGTSHHGRGFMREAVEAAVPAAFRMLDLDTIVAEAQPLNEASRTILERCGMALVGERMTFAPARNRDELSVVYEITRPVP